MMDARPQRTGVFGASSRTGHALLVGWFATWAFARDRILSQAASIDSRREAERRINKIFLV
jgi:hypothetical protein